MPPMKKHNNSESRQDDNMVKFQQSNPPAVGNEDGEGGAVAIVKTTATLPDEQGGRKHAKSLQSSMDSTSVDRFRDENDDEHDLGSLARRKLLIACALSFTFMIAEVIGGVISGSLAIMTDALHLLTDLAGFGISIFALTLSKRPASRKLTFGWYRAEILGALISVILVWAITAILVLLAIQRIIDFTFEIEPQVMLITSSLGVAINLFMGVQLQHGHSHSHGHGHGHGHSHGHGAEGNKTRTMSNAEHCITQGNSHQSYGTASDEQQQPEHQRRLTTEGTASQMNIRAALMNMLGDLCQSVGVMVASLIIYFKPDYKIADPICTFLFSVLVLITTLQVVKDVFYILMEGAPGNVDYEVMKADLLKIPGVLSVHHVRIWALTSAKVAMAAHIDYSGDNYANVLKDCRRMLRSKYGITDLTLQIEPESACYV